MNRRGRLTDAGEVAGAADGRGEHRDARGGRQRVPSALDRAARLLMMRLEMLEPRLESDDAAWPEYRDTAAALASIAAQIEPGRRGELLTTQQMAARLGIAPKTLLKHKARGGLRPALQRGKLIRWRGDEAAR